MTFGKEKKEVRYKSWHGWLFLVVLIISMILGLVQKIKQPKYFVELNNFTCNQSGGEWQECGSVCRGSDEPCIEVCQEYCLCHNDSQCPYGYDCVDFINGEGICQERQ